MRALLLIVMVFVTACDAVIPSGPPAQDGVVDLRDWRPDDGPIRLDGEWSLAWGVLDGPDAPPSPTQSVQVPGPWESETRSRRGYGTYHLTMLFPEDSPEMAIRVGAMGGAGRAWVAGVALPPMGTVSTDPDQMQEDVRIVSSRFDPHPQTQVVVQASNARHRASGIRRPVVLGTADQIDTLERRLIAFDTALVSIMLTVGLVFIFVFTLRREQKSLLGFGTTVILLAIRHTLSGSGELWVNMGPDVSWLVRIRIEYLLATVGLSTGYWTMLLLTGSNTAEWRHRIPVFFSVVATCAALFLPVAQYDVAFGLLAFATLVAIGGSVVEVVRSMWRGQRVYGMLILGSLLVFVSGIAHDTIGAAVGRSLANGEVLAPAFIVMLLIQGVTVALAFAHALRRGEVLHESSLLYVPRDVLRLLRRDSIVEVQRGDQAQLDMDVLFTDIRGYTTIAESMSSSALFPTLNTYLSYVVPPISDGGGFVSQYLGDGIMALFHGGADKAVHAAIAMSRALEAFNADHPDVPSFQVGMGMSSGAVTLGIIGSSNRLDSNIVGDPANQASRVEGMTKTYGTVFLIDEHTYNRLKHPKRIHVRELDRVIAKGKTVPTRIYEVLDALPGPRRALREQTLDAFTRALDAYRLGDFRTARPAFQECVTADPDDVAAGIYLSRIAAWEGPIPPDWNGTHALTHK